MRMEYKGTPEFPRDAIDFINTNWENLSVDTIKRQVNLPVSSIHYIAFGLLGKQKIQRRGGTNYGFQSLSEVKTLKTHVKTEKTSSKTPSVSFPSIITKTAGYSFGETIPVRAYERGNMIILEITKNQRTEKQQHIAAE